MLWRICVWRGSYMVRKRKACLDSFIFSLTSALMIKSPAEEPSQSLHLSGLQKLSSALLFLFQSSQPHADAK